VFLAVSVLSGVTLGSSVTATDTDGNRLTDATESTLGTDPNDVDSDGDGANNPNEATGDNDGDGTPDYRDPKDDAGPDGDLKAAELPAIDEKNKEQPCARGSY